MKPVALVFGASFGFLLCWARITDYDTIRSMLLLQDLYVFWMMGAAVVTAAIGLRVLGRAGARTVVGREAVAWSTTRPTRAHVMGSALFGAGWALAGTCPGPALAQLGSGHLAALFTIAGLLGGVALRGWVARRTPVPAPSPTAVAGL